MHARRLLPAMGRAGRLRSRRQADHIADHLPRRAGNRAFDPLARRRIARTRGTLLARCPARSVGALRAVAVMAGSVGTSRSCSRGRAPAIAAGPVDARRSATRVGTGSRRYRGDQAARAPDARRSEAMRTIPLGPVAVRSMTVCTRVSPPREAVLAGPAVDLPVRRVPRHVVGSGQARRPLAQRAGEVAGDLIDDGHRCLAAAWAATPLGSMTKVGRAVRIRTLGSTRGPARWPRGWHKKREAEGPPVKPAGAGGLCCGADSLPLRKSLCNT